MSRPTAEDTTIFPSDDLKLASLQLGWTTNSIMELTLMSLFSQLLSYENKSVPKALRASCKGVFMQRKAIRVRIRALLAPRSTAAHVFTVAQLAWAKIKAFSGCEEEGESERAVAYLAAARDFFKDAPVEELRGDQEEILIKLCDWDANKTFDKLDAWRMLEPPDEMDEETTKLLDDLRSVYDTMVSNAAWHIRDDGLKKDFATYLVAVSSWPGEASKANEHYMESIRNFIILMDIAFKLGELGQEQLWRNPPKTRNSNADIGNM